MLLGTYFQVFVPKSCPLVPHLSELRSVNLHVCYSIYGSCSLVYHSTTLAVGFLGTLKVPIYLKLVVMCSAWKSSPVWSFVQIS